jgi:hypothetical protein
MSRGFFWCFTLNNPIEHGPAPETWPDIVLLVYQQEIGKEETLHYQGYVEFSKTKRISSLKNINKHCHWEPRKGSRIEAIKYCMKEDTRVKDTEPVVIGKLPDLDPEDAKAKKIKTSMLVKRMLDEGKADLDIANEYFGYYLQTYRGINQYRLLLSEERDFKTVVTVIVGKTGTGKSSWCAKWCKDPYWKSRGQWWDGYHNQGVVIIDEFYGWLKYDDLLRLLDRYPYKVEVKGGYVQFNSKLIFITSNKKPEEWYHNTETGPLLRRIDNLWLKDTLEGDFTVIKGIGPAFLMAGFKELSLNSEIFALDESHETPDINCIQFEDLD